MTGTIGTNNNVVVFINFVKPVKITTYNLFGFVQDKTLWNITGNGFGMRKYGLLNFLRIFNTRYNILFLFFKLFVLLGDFRFKLRMVRFKQGTNNVYHQKRKE